jgi:superfamily I DNA and RNA helicase
VTAPAADDDDVVIGLQNIAGRLANSKLVNPLSQVIFDELVSVIDGSKALIRPPERNIEPFGDNSKVAQIQALEEEIRRFDRDQRVAYMTDVNGPQRIRGLAGSGKTVVLAMKVALLAIRNPDARIAFTFYTKSLYQHVKQLITRFYRLHEDRDPDWSRIKVLHSWGGSFVEGFYSHACGVLGVPAMTYGQAASISPHGPFELACERLLASGNISPIFDYVFVDEAQDFPPQFMRLALKLAVEERLVIAYDVLQTIFDVETPTAGSLFGFNSENEPTIVFDEDIILHKCYRNPREILVCAHAIGFGIYGPRVMQMLESKEHWEDFGYKIVQGNLISGSAVRIERPKENSPSSISDKNTPDELISAHSFSTAGQEVIHVANQIKADIEKSGVPAEDILVISADDRNARFYFSSFHMSLAATE